MVVLLHYIGTLAKHYVNRYDILFTFKMKNDFFERGSYYVALIGPELDMSKDSQHSARLCLLSAGIKSGHHMSSKNGYVLKLIYFMHLNVLSVCVFVHYMHIWCLVAAEAKEGIGFPGTTIIDC